MAEKDPIKNLKSLRPIGKVATPAGGVELVFEQIPGHSDAEVAEESATFAVETRADYIAKVEPSKDGSTGSRSVHFVGSRWKAPWQPTGPRPNWGYEPPEKADPTKPIN